MSVKSSQSVDAVSHKINQLAATAAFLPGLIYASMCVIGALLVYLYLPETKFCPMAQTIEESEGLVRGKEKAWAANMSAIVSTE